MSFYLFTLRWHDFEPRNILTIRVKHKLASCPLQCCNLLFRQRNKFLSINRVGSWTTWMTSLWTRVRIWKNSFIWHAASHLRFRHWSNKRRVLIINWIFSSMGRPIGSVPYGHINWHRLWRVHRREGARAGKFSYWYIVHQKPALVFFFFCC